MYLRAPAANEPFAGQALIQWARSNNWIPFNPRGTVTPFPGAGLLPVPGVPFWPQPASWATSLVPYPTRGMGDLPGGIDATVQQLRVLVEREIGGIVETRVKDVFKSYVIPPLAGVAAVSIIALIVAVAASRKSNPTRARRHRNRRSRRHESRGRR